MTRRAPSRRAMDGLSRRSITKTIRVRAKDSAASSSESGSEPSGSGGSITLLAQVASQQRGEFGRAHHRHVSALDGNQPEFPELGQRAGEGFTHRPQFGGEDSFG